jgi:hypothetical protein
MPLSDYLPDFADPNSMAAWGALSSVLAAGSQPRYDPAGRGISGGSLGNALTTLAAAGMGGAVEGAKGAQQYQANQLTNQQAQVMNPIQQQQAQMGLEQSQAMQPGQLALLKSMYGDGTSVPGSMGGIGAGNGAVPGSGTGGALTMADQLGARALMAAYASKDQKQISTAYLSLYEHNPQLAGAVKAAQEGSDPKQMPDGTYQLGGGAFGSPAPQGAGVATTPSPPPATAFPSQPTIPASTTPAMATAATQAAQAAIPRTAAFMPPQPQQPAPVQPPKTEFVPMDGKPILPGVSDNAPPSPFGQPHFTTPNTTSGVADHNKLRDTAIEQNTELSATGQQTAQMLARLHDMANAAQNGQMGTLIAQDPELAQKAVAAGLITNGKLTNDLAQIQRFSSDQMMEVINQLKMTNSGPGGGKLMRAEVQGAAEKMADPRQQPQAIHDILAIGEGLGNYNQDMLKSWQAKGGLGNSLNNGDSMLAQDFQARFSTAHDIDDYIAQAKKNMPQFAGMPAKYHEGQTAVNPSTNHTLTFRGGKWQ